MEAPPQRMMIVQSKIYFQHGYRDMRKKRMNVVLIFPYGHLLLSRTSFFMGMGRRRKKRMNIVLFLVTTLLVGGCSAYLSPEKGGNRFSEQFCITLLLCLM
jgi:hypothetical protein